MNLLFSFIFILSSFEFVNGQKMPNGCGTLSAQQGILHLLAQKAVLTQVNGTNGRALQLGQ